MTFLVSIACCFMCLIVGVLLGDWYAGRSLRKQIEQKDFAMNGIRISRDGWQAQHEKLKGQMEQVRAEYDRNCKEARSVNQSLQIENLTMGQRIRDLEANPAQLEDAKLFIAALQSHATKHQAEVDGLKAKIAELTKAYEESAAIEASKTRAVGILQQECAGLRARVTAFEDLANRK